MIRSRRAEQDALSIERCCQLLHLTRSVFYAHEVDEGSEQVADELVEQIQQLADKRSAYGYRRISADLQKRGHRRATTKRVRARMRSLGLSRRRKRRKARTTTPGKGPASPNLAADLKLSGLRQLLVTDITYVALPKGFGYVSVILDAYSRRALGWAASESLATDLPLEALNMALATADLPDGWVHHSDRGCQYTSLEYKQRVLESKGQLSNSRSGCPYDNAAMESFFKTYKYEEANAHSFQNLNELKLNLSEYLEDYNSHRLHSSIGYCSPIEFENLNAQKQERISVL